MGRPGAKPRRKTNPSWTPELAYACGLIASDGCLISDGRHINLTSKDIDQLETFKGCLDLKVKISWKPSTFVKEKRPQVQFGDVVLYRWLVSIGITPRKTHTIGEIKIPDRYFFDYLRGEFDGDGHSHAYWDTRWRSSVCLYIGFSCASKKHLQWLRDSMCRLIDVSGYIAPSRSIYQLLYSKTKAREVYQAMYHTSNIPHLRRKKEKLDRQWRAVAQAHQGKQPRGFKRGGPMLRIA